MASEQKYRAEFSYGFYKCEGGEGHSHKDDVLMHGVKDGCFENMEYEDMVKLEAAIMTALADLGTDEIKKKKDRKGK